MFFLPGAIDEQDFVSGFPEGTGQARLTRGPPPPATTQHHEGPWAESAAQRLHAVAAEDDLEACGDRTFADEGLKAPHQMTAVRRGLIQRQRIWHHVEIHNSNARAKLTGQPPRTVQRGESGPDTGIKD